MRVKALSVILSLAFLLLLVSCGTNTDTGADVSTDTSTVAGTDVSVGTAVGNRLPSFEAQRFDGNGTMQEYIDPTSLGKITVINFWGTWCPPCVGELPHFSEVAKEYKGEVCVVAIHSDYKFTVNSVDLVRNDYSDSDIIFAKDKNTSGGLDDLHSLCGGKGSYPYTIIIDENGVITYKVVGAISKDKLISEIEKAKI